MIQKDSPMDHLSENDSQVTVFLSLMLSFSFKCHLIECIVSHSPPGN